MERGVEKGENPGHHMDTDTEMGSREYRRVERFTFAKRELLCCTDKRQLFSLLN